MDKIGLYWHYTFKTKSNKIKKTNENMHISIKIFICIEHFTMSEGPTS